jgi:plasmid replication initiation protein
MPIASFLKYDEDENYTLLKHALLSLAKKVFTYEDEKVWKAIQLIIAPKIIKNSGFVEFKLHEDIYDALLNFSKGYKKYELQTVFQFDSRFAMRFYELFSKQRTPLVFSISDLKLMFGVEDKYKLPAGFIQSVVEPAQKELNEKSPYSFEFTVLKTGRSITAIKFYPKYIPENMDEEFEGMQLKKQISPSLMLEKHILNYLKDSYSFSTQELKNNAELFYQAQKQIPDLLMFLSEVKANANRAKNPKGYLINALKTRLKIKKSKKEKAVPAAEQDIFTCTGIF